jgi:hypothetical protein
VAVLRNYVSILRLSDAQCRAACSELLAELAAAEGPLALSSCIFAAGNGCMDQAFEVLEAALDMGRGLKPDNHEGFGMARAQSPLQVFVRAGGESIARSERFPALCARLGLAQYWLETKKWPDCAAEAPYDFKAACAAAVAALPRR